MSSEELTPKNIIWIALGSVITMLIGVNAFFVKNLVEKVGKVDSIETRISVIETKMDYLISGFYK